MVRIQDDEHLDVAVSRTNIAVILKKPFYP